MRKLQFLLLSLFIVSGLFAQIPAGYYNGTEGLSGDALKLKLYSIIKGHTEYPYTATTTDTWDILKLADQDTVNPDNIILIYSGLSVNAAQEYNSGAGWTREHVWSKSHGFPPATGQDPAPGPGTDCHHLRPEKSSVNAAKQNKDFDVGGTVVASAPGCHSTSNTWEPRDEVKGDVARMIFYMATRYEGENGEPNLQIVDYTPSIDPPVTGEQPLYGKLSTLLLWNLQDPPDNFERHRNEVVYGFQHNRNPFIDHPEWVNCIWASCNQQVTFTTLPVTAAVSGTSYNYNIKFAGLAGKTLTISSVIIPDWLNLSQTNNTSAVLSGTPTEANVGTDSVKLQLTDGTSTIFQKFSIDVTLAGSGTTITGLDFTTCPPVDWTTYSVASSKNWTCIAGAGTAGYEEMNGYLYSGGSACDDWFISPKMNLNNFTAENFSFDSWVKYTDVTYPRLTLKYSSDYVIGQNPENYAWTDLLCTLSASNSQTWTQSGIVDLSAKEDTAAFVAFQYTSTGSTSGTCEDWRIDNILLTGTPKIISNVNSEIKKTSVELFPNPCRNKITLSYYLQNKSSVNLEIYNVSGLKLKSFVSELQNSGNHNTEINLSDLPSGVYFVKMNIDGKLFNKKIVKF